MSLQSLIRREVVTQPPTATCLDAAELMRDRRVGSIVVVEDEQPLGVVTDRDLVLRVMLERRNPERVFLREVMSENPIFLSHRRSLTDAVETMRDLRVRRLPIVDDRQRLVGIVTLDDVLMHLARLTDALGRAVELELGPPPAG